MDIILMLSIVFLGIAGGYVILKIYYELRLDYMFENKQYSEVQEIEVLYALNNVGVNNLSGGFFLGGFNTTYGIEYKYLVNTENGFQMKTIRGTSDVYIKEVEGLEGNTGRKIKIYNSLKHLKDTSLKTAYQFLSEDFDDLAERYSKTIIEVPKGTVKFLFDVDVSK